MLLEVWIAFAGSFLQSGKSYSVSCLLTVFWKFPCIINFCLQGKHPYSPLCCVFHLHRYSHPVWMYCIGYSLLPDLHYYLQDLFRLWLTYPCGSLCSATLKFSPLAIYHNYLYTVFRDSIRRSPHTRSYSMCTTYSAAVCTQSNPSLFSDIDYCSPFWTYCHFSHILQPKNYIQFSVNRRITSL